MEKRGIEMKKYLKNDNGLTLVEILAALVLLSIVLVAFMTFFTQSAKFTAHNHETLTAVQVSEQVIAKVRKGNYQTTTEQDVGNYKVEIKIFPETSEVKLMRAVITVIPKSNQKIKSEPFKTEMYFKRVSP